MNHFVAPNGLSRGMNPGRFGGTASGTGVDFGKLWTKRLYTNMISKNELISKETARTDIEALLEKGPTVKNIINIIVLEGDSMMTSAMNCVYNINYSTVTNENLLDSITKIEIIPAPEKRDGAIPEVTNCITMDRVYSITHNHSMVVVTGNMMNALMEANNNIVNSSYSRLSTKNLHDPVLDRLRKEQALHVLKTIKRGIASETAYARTSLVLAIPATALNKLIEGSVPLSLSETNIAYATSITDLNDMKSTFSTLKNRTATRQIFQNYVKNEIKNTFGLAKTPSFLNNLILMGDRSLGSVVKDRLHGYSDTMTIHGEHGQVFPIKGVLLVSSMLFENFPQSREGVRKGLVPLYALNESAYTKDNSNNVFIKLHDTDTMSQNVGDMPREVMDHTSFGQDNEAAFQELADVGATLLNIEDEPSGIIRGSESRERQFLGYMKVNTPCRYIIHQNAAILLDNIQEYHTGLPANHARADQTNSGMTKRHEMTRVSAGDYDYNQINMIADSATYDPQADGNSKQKNVYRMVGQPEVYMHTPDISSARHIFRKREFKRVFLDPLMHSGHDIALNYNKMFRSAITCETETSHDYMDYFQEVSRILRDRNNLLKDSLLFNSASAKNELASVEVHPFYQTELHMEEVNDPRKHTIEFNRRHVLGELPHHVMPLEEHIRNGILMANTISSGSSMMLLLNELKEAHEKLAQNEYDTIDNLVANSTDLVKRFVSSLSNVVSQAFPNAAYHKMIDFSRAFLIPFVIMPYLSAGRSRPLNPIDIMGDEDAVKRAIEASDAQVVQLFKKSTGDDDFCVIASDTANGDDCNFCLTNLTTLHANATVLASSGDQYPELVRLCSLVSLLIRTTPYALKHLVQNSYNMGLAIDFMRMEEMYAPDLIYTKPHAMSMVLSSKNVVPKVALDEEMTYEMNSTVQTVSNMIGGTAVRVHGAIPNPRADDRACEEDPSVPRISADHLSVLGIDDIKSFVENNKLRLGQRVTPNLVHGELILDDEQSKCIIDAMAGCFKREESDELLQNRNPPPDHAYVAMLRPPMRPSAGPLPYLGIARHEAASLDENSGHSKFPRDSSSNSFRNFYMSKLPSINPFISNLGALYNQRFMESNANTSRGFVPHTMNKKGYHNLANGTLTSRALQEALNLTEAHLATMTEPQVAAFKNILARHERMGGDVKMTYPMQPSQGTNSILGPQHIVARLGYSVPLTYSTDREALRRARQDDVDVFVSAENPALMAVQSPYRVPFFK